MNKIKVSDKKYKLHAPTIVTEEAWINTTLEHSSLDLIYCGPATLEIKLFKSISCMFQYKTLISYCGPTLPPGRMAWKNLNLNYLEIFAYQWLIIVLQLLR